MKNKNKNLKIFIASIIFCIIEFVLILSDLLTSINRNLSVYSSSREQQVSSILASCSTKSDEGRGDLASRMISVLEDNLPASSSVYCVVAVDDNIIYLKDKYTTIEVIDQNNMRIDQFLRQSGYTPKKLGSLTEKTVKAILDNNKTYLVTMDTIEYGGKAYTLCICTKVEYIMKKNGFDILKIHIFIYITLFIIVFISLTFFLLQENKKDKAKISEMGNELVSSRLLVDKLYGEVIETKRPNRFFGFYHKQIIMSVLNKLTPEQAKMSAKIMVRINKSEQYIFSYLAALLENINTFKCVSCIWSEEEFMILLLNTTGNDAELLVQTIRKQYQLKYDLELVNVFFSIGPIKNKTVETEEGTQYEI